MTPFSITRIIDNPNRIQFAQTILELNTTEDATETEVEGIQEESGNVPAETLAQEPTADTIASIEELIDVFQIDGCFPTPEPIAVQMIELAEIQPGMTVLDPSAGKGNILDVVTQSVDGVAVSAIEINVSLQRLLTAKGYNLIGDDFLQFSILTGGFDRILLNPPFEQGQDADHVRHAYQCLNDGGRIVAIMSEGVFFRGDRESKEFCQWLESVEGLSTRLPDGSFSKAERRTGVRCRMVVIDKGVPRVAASQTTKLAPNSAVLGGFAAKTQLQPGSVVLGGQNPESAQRLKKAQLEYKKQQLLLRLAEIDGQLNSQA